MSDDRILVLDSGTTSTRALLFDRSGTVLAQAQEPISQFFPEPGWVEHDALEIAALSAQVLAQVAGELGGPLPVLAITNQRETVVVWDKATGQPIHKAIVWQDRRTAATCAALAEAGHGPMVEQATGLRLDPYFSATKIAWILDHVAGARESAEAGRLLAGTIECWLTWCWSGAHISDATNASRTLLYDIHSGDWSDALCALFRVPRSLLPRVTDSAGLLASLSVPGLDRPLALCGLAGDQQAAAIGQNCLAPGTAKATYGTGAFLLVHAGETPLISRSRLLGTVAWQIGGQRRHALEGSLFVAGSAVQWLRDGIGIVASAGETASLAASVADSAGVHLVPAFAGLGAPWWDADARGLLCGLTRGTTRAHIARATLEAMSQQTADLLDAFAADGLPVRSLRIDGGMAANDWMMDDMADMLDMPVERPVGIESTAWGAAMLAMVGSGLAASLEEAGACWRTDRRAEPRLAASGREQRRRDWQLAVARAMLKP
jgi:glycerol kinase